MSRIIWEGFEPYSGTSQDQIGSKWDGFTSSDTNGVQTDGDSRFSGAKHFYYNSGAYFYKAFANKTHVFCGLAVRGPTSMASGISTMFGLLDGSTYQVIATVNADGSVSLRPTRTGSAFATTAGSLVVSTVWNFWEFDITIHGSTGAVEIFKEGASVASATGQNTAPSGSAQVNLLRLGGVDGSVYVGQNKIDDFYMNDNGGSAPFDARFGDCRVYPLRPSGAGTTTDFTPSTGSNYQNVDETVTNDDTDYNSSSTPSDRDLYAFDNLPGPFAGTIFGIAHSSRLKKDDAGARTAAQVTKVGSTTTVESAVSLSTSYATYATVMDESPDTTDPFTKSEIDGIEGGVEVAS